MPTADAIAAAAEVGVTRIVQIGCDLAGARWAVAGGRRARRARRRGGAASQRGPAAGRARASWRTRWRRSRRSPGPATGCARWGRPAWTTSAPGRRAAPPSRRPSAGTSTSPSGSTGPWSSTTGTPTTTCCAILDEEGVPERFVMHCFSGDADFARACLDRGALAVVRRDRHLQERRAAAGGAAPGPAGPGAGRDRRAVPDPDAVPWAAERVLPGAAHDALDGGDPRGRTWPGCARPWTPTPRRPSAAPGSPNGLVNCPPDVISHTPYPGITGQIMEKIWPCGPASVWSCACWPGAGKFSDRTQWRPLTGRLRLRPAADGEGTAVSSGFAPVPQGKTVRVTRGPGSTTIGESCGAHSHV